MLKSDVLYRMVYRNGRLCFLLLIAKFLQRTVLEAAHEQNAHQGLTRAYAVICDKYYWPISINDVAK